MDAFFLIVFGGLLVVVLGFVALGLWSPHSLRDVTGASDDARLACQAEVEERDVPEMLAAHNASRRRRGKRALTQGEIQAEAQRRQRKSIERAQRGA